MRRRRPATIALTGAVTLVLALTTAACGADSPNTAQTLVIGVSSSQPGLGERSDAGTWSGFEVDLGRYLAAGLGFTEDEVEFTEVVPANREQMLADGSVDLVLAQYPVPVAEDPGPEDATEEPTESPEPVVELSTPYFTAHQDLLVAEDDTAITDLESIDDPDRVLCSVTGSGKAQRVRDDYAPQVDLQEFDSYGLCVDALLEGSIDAVTTDDIILAGYAEEHPGQVRVVGSLYAPEQYAVGLPAGSRVRDRVDTLVRQAIEDGTWAEALEDNLGHAGWDPPPPPEGDPA